VAYGWICVNLEELDKTWYQTKMNPLESATPPNTASTPAISLDAVIPMTGRSKRTWLRRIEDGAVPRVGYDSRGRALLDFQSVRPSIGISLTEEDVGVLLQADQGDAVAQADIGAMFFVAASGEPKDASNLGDLNSLCMTAAVYWLEKAADQQQEDAMHWLAQVYATGYGGESSANLSVMWLAKAAAKGHVIATAQMNEMMSGIRTKAAPN